MWFALEVAHHAVIRLVDNTSRLNFIGTIEHATESVPSPLDYESSSIGPEQRIATNTGKIFFLRISTLKRVDVETVHKPGIAERRGAFLLSYTQAWQAGQKVP